MVQPGVFSPKNTVSTKVFLDYITTLKLPQKSILELGCGSGIISIQCAAQGAMVTASDINAKAIESLLAVSEKQGFQITGIVSDLLNKMDGNHFDYIFINPPYYPKKPHNLEEKAWFCGENFEFFEKLMDQLSTINLKKTSCLMILSDACDFLKIEQIAKDNKLALNQVFTIKLTFEKNTIYRIVPS
jgi:release factor glutamine methyltransferase